MGRRASSLGPHDIFLLDQWGRQLWEAFGDYPYLVGSVARAEERWRDVDLRLAIPDEIWPAYVVPPVKLHTLNVAMSVWGRQVTGLPIDFQFQSATQFREADGPVNPMGLRARNGYAT